MEDVRKILGVVDRPHLPPPGGARATIFKEWYHFNLLDTRNGLDIIFNLSFAGDVLRTGAGKTDLILLTHRRGRGWRGGIDTYEPTAADIDPARLDIRLGHNRIFYENGAYHVNARMRDEPIALDATLDPLTHPMMVWNDTPLGSGHLNWLIVPQLSARGTIEIDGRKNAFTDICAYHDHNWGYWNWGEDFGWDWGFATNMDIPSGEGRTTVVFDRTADRQGMIVSEQTLAVWRDAELVKLFTRRMLRARREGVFTGAVPRLPGVMHLIAHGAVLTIPARYHISARDGGDWLDAIYHIDAGLQISIPADFGFGHVGLNETFGTMEIKGVIGGKAVEYTARACFEFMG